MVEGTQTELSLKWPRRLTLMRHALSEYNDMTAKRKQDPLYLEFVEAYAQDPTSQYCHDLAVQVAHTHNIARGDYATKLAEGALEAARQTGQALKKVRQGQVPDVIFVSPYLRTHGTLQALIEGWPELSQVLTYEERLLREREHGLLMSFNSKKVFFTLFPEQKERFEQDGNYWYRWPQGESLPDMQDRLLLFQLLLTEEHSGEDVLVISHQEAILSFRTNLERLNHQELLRLDEEEKPVNCGITTYVGVPGAGRKGKGKLVLESYNQRLVP